MRFVIHFSLAICLAVLVAMSAFRAAAEDRGSADAPKEPIAQKCLDNIHAFDEQLWRVGFGVLSTTGVVGNPLRYCFPRRLSWIRRKIAGGAVDGTSRNGGS